MEIVRANNPISTFDLLDKIAAILGTTKSTFWPLLDVVGDDTLTVSYGSGLVQSSQLQLRDEAAPRSWLGEGAPSLHIGGIHSVRLLTVSGAANNHLQGADSTNYEFGDATLDAPFSIGIWVLIQEALGTARSLLAKYGSTAILREYDFRFGTNGKLVMELFDESVDTSEIATSVGTALKPGIWQFCTMTYDGDEAAPVINLYINGVSVHDGTSVETGAYVAMEASTTPLLVGARDVTATPAQVLQGSVALPFITGKALSAAEVSSLYYYGQRLLGLA